MMGTKIHHFAPLPVLSLEELVPKDNFYRRLEATLDLSLVRDLVRDCYASSGRPSVDPVVFFRLLLVMFFEGICCEVGVVLRQRVPRDRAERTGAAPQGVIDKQCGNNGPGKHRPRSVP
jgi:hypothetical protein